MSDDLRTPHETRDRWSAQGHVIEVQQFDKPFLDKIFKRAGQIKSDLAKHYRATGGPAKFVSPSLEGRVLLDVFVEESTRTRISFESAAIKLGMRYSSSVSAKQTSSLAKGESMRDMIVNLNGYYPDIVVLRSDQEGTAAQVAAESLVPVINGGDGKGQHPTQALLDVFTIMNKIGRITGLKVVIGGDLATGRTVRSLAYLLARQDHNELHFISPKDYAITDDVRMYLNQHNTNFFEHRQDAIEEVFAGADVVYWTRTQAERGSVTSGETVLTPAEVSKMPETGILMHPLPRVGEITEDVDEMVQASYFDQSANGLPVRMALLEWAHAQNKKYYGW